MRRILPPRNNLFFQRTNRKPSRPVLDPTHPLSKGLVAFWPMGDNGISLTELVRGNTALAANGPLVMAKGAFGGPASTFNGSNQKCTVGTLLGPLAQFTLVANVNTTTTTRQSILVNSDAALSVMNFYFETNRIGFLGGGYREASFTALTANTPHHVAATYQHYTAGGTGTLLAYVDGVVAGTLTQSDNPTFNTAVADFAIGELGAAGTNFFSGTMEGIRIYNRALSQAEILWLKAEPYAGVYEATGSYLIGSTSAALTSTANMAFSGISFAGAGTRSGASVGNLAFHGISFVGAGARKETATGNMAFPGISFTASGRVGRTAVGNMAFRGISITAGVVNAGIPGAGLRQFWTF